MVKPIDVRVYGKLSPDAEAWIRQFGVLSKAFEQYVAGFMSEMAGSISPDG